MVAEVPAAPNQPNTFVPRDCDCFVCTALSSREPTPWTRELEWSTDELYPNIVGFRRRDSIHNKFDDRLMVFLRPLAANPAKARTLDALQNAVGAELLADLKRSVDDAASSVRVCECRAIGGNAPGLWVVLWLVITTDPGETIDSAYKKLLRGVSDLAEKPKPLPLDPELDNAAQAKRRVKVDEAKLKLRQYEDDPAHRRVVFRVRGGLHPADVHGGGGHGITDRRGMMALGQVKNQFQIGLHHRDRVLSGAGGAQVALICLKPVGWRMWTGAAVRDATPDPARPKSAKNVQHHAFLGAGVVRHAVHGSLDDAPWTKSKRLVWEGERWFVIDDSSGGARVEVQTDDVLFLADSSVAGTNHHRAHSVRVKGGALEEGTPEEFGGGGAGNSAAVSKQLATWEPPRQEVNSWSEGCQVNPGFFAFNLFLRLITLSTRWRCHVGKKRAAQCTVIEAGTATTLSDTELCLFDGPDREANAWRRYLDLILGRYRSLAEARAITDKRVRAAELAVKEAKEAKRPSPKTIAKAETEQTNALTAQREAKASATAFVDASPWIMRYDNAVCRIEKASGDLKVANAMSKRSAEREGKVTSAKEELKQATTDANTVAGELTSPEAFRRDATRHFRMYTPVMQKQFVRGCDLNWGCRSYLDYTLVEVTDDDIGLLDKRFGDASRMARFNPDSTLVIG